VRDPATGRLYSIDLECGLDLALAGVPVPNTLDFDALGRPTNAGVLNPGDATFTITGASGSRTVTVRPLTGFAIAQ
jgi:hypothetical protein